jgi:hypothetical protein
VSTEVERNAVNDGIRIQRGVVIHAPASGSSFYAASVMLSDGFSVAATGMTEREAIDALFNVLVSQIDGYEDALRRILSGQGAGGVVALAALGGNHRAPRTGG